MESNIKEVKGVNEYGEMHLGNPNHNTFPDIFDHIHCIVNDLRCLSSSHIEKLIQKCIKPNNHFPIPGSNPNVHALLQYFDVGELESDNDLYNNEDNKRRADRDDITRKLCTKISTSSDWRIASKAVDLLHRIIVRYSTIRDTEVVADMNEARIKEVLVILDKKIETINEDDDNVKYNQWKLIYSRLQFALIEWTHLQIQRHDYLKESLKMSVLPVLNQCSRYKL